MITAAIALSLTLCSPDGGFKESCNDYYIATDDDWKQTQDCTQRKIKEFKVMRGVWLNDKKLSGYLAQYDIVLPANNPVDALTTFEYTCVVVTEDDIP